MWDLQMTGDVALLVGLLLLPGVVAVLVRDALAETNDRDIKKTFVYAAVYDVFIYSGLLPLSLAGLTPYPTSEPFNPLTIVAAIGLAVILGAVTGSVYWHRYWQRLGFRLGMTKKATANTWVDAFQAAEAKGAWALVHLKDGRRLLGAPTYYSASEGATSVYLTCGSSAEEPVAIYSASGQKLAERRGPGVLITPAAEITLVEFLDGKTAPEKE